MIAFISAETADARATGAFEPLWGNYGEGRREIRCRADELDGVAQAQAQASKNGAKVTILALGMTLRNMERHLDEAEKFMLAAQSLPTKGLVIPVGYGDLDIGQVIDRASILADHYSIRVVMEIDQHSTLAEVDEVVRSGRPYSIDMEAMDQIMARDGLDLLLVERAVHGAAFIKVSGPGRTMLESPPWWYDMVSDSPAAIFSVAKPENGYAPTDADILRMESEKLMAAA